MNSRKEEERKIRAMQDQQIREIAIKSAKSGIKEYGYVDDGIVRKTKDKGFASSMNAERRFHNMNKFRKAIYKLTGQFAKFKKLRSKTNDMELSKAERLEAAKELDGMFGGKGAR